MVIFIHSPRLVGASDNLRKLFTSSNDAYYLDGRDTAITRSEQVHMDQIAAILKTNKYWNPTLTRAPSVFYNSSLQALYNKLIAQGSVDYASAMGVGVAIEELDISDFPKMIGVDMPADMKLALDNLMQGSLNHLAAFRR